MMIPTHSRKVFRANLDDVENLSYGRGAKKQRGTGSRFTCHRLNRDERRIFDQAKRDGYLTVRGTGYRKNRKGSPVGNTFRQRCDALAQICVIVEKRSDSDRVVIDFSTLRVQDDSPLVSFLTKTIFRVDYPDFYEALISKNRDSNNSQKIGLTYDNVEKATNDCKSVQVENTTHRPIHWETVRSKAIWGVDERLLAVTCDREVAKSIAIKTLKVIDSPHFVGLHVDAEASQELITVEPITAIAESLRTGGEESAERNNTKPREGDISTTSSSNSSDDINCIDWNDI